MAFVTTTINTWLYSLLSGDPTIADIATKVYADFAADATPPYIVFNPQSPGVDLDGMGARRIMTTAVYQVRAVAKTGTFGGDLVTLAERIDALLHRASGAAAGGLVLASVREQVVSRTELSDGVVYKHLGGIYRIIAQ